MLAFKVIGTAVGLLISLLRTVLILSVRYWKVSLPIFGLLLIFMFSTWWGVFFLLPVTITIIVLLLRRKPEKGLTAEERDFKNRLGESSHLQDFFAPLNELRYTNANGSPNTHARKSAVKNAISSISPTISHGGAEAMEVLFRVTSDTKRFETQTLPAMRNELRYDRVEPAASATEVGGFFKVVITPERAVEDILLSQTFNADEVYAGIPMADRNLMKVPIAIGEDSQVRSLSVHHTIVAGVSGSGKGSPFQSMLQYYCTAPEGESSFFDSGLFTCYMIDPKSAEFSAFRSSVIPEAVTTESGRSFSVASADVEEIEAVIATVHARMTAREKIGRRSFVPSKNTPLLILFWDEFSSSIADISKDATQQLMQILSKGRSLGVFLVAASQEVNKSVLGSARSHFSNKLMLKLATSYDAVTLTQLPEEYLASLGVRPSEIEPSNQANGFRTSGLGWICRASDYVAGVVSC